MQPLMQQKWFLEQEGNQTSKNLSLELKAVDKNLTQANASRQTLLAEVLALSQSLRSWLCPNPSLILALSQSIWALQFDVDTAMAEENASRNILLAEVQLVEPS